MKKVLILTLIAFVFCVLTFSVSAAEIPAWTETNLEYDALMKDTSQFGIVNDTTSRIMFDDGKTYPVWYFTKTETNNGIVYFGNATSYAKLGLNFATFKDKTGVAYTAADVVKIEVPKGVTGVGAGAFRQATGFTSLLYVKVPEGVTTLANYAFKASGENKGVIKQVDLPDSITTIGTEVFMYQPIEKIHIGSGITTIPTSTFCRCYQLSVIEGGENVISVGKDAFAKAPITDVGNFFDNVESIGENAFYYFAAEEIILPKVKTVGAKAFYEAPNLQKVAVAPNVTIGENAFKAVENKSKLETVILGSGSTIATNSFYFCKTIKEVIFIGTDTSCISTVNNVKSAPITTGASYCQEFYNGNHKYADDIKSCTSDVACTRTEYCSYAKESEFTEHNMVRTFVYANGFDQNGLYNCVCTNATYCIAEDITDEDYKYAKDQKTDPIIVFKGYSVPEKANYKGINAGFEINKILLALYEKVNSDTVKFNLLMVNSETSEKQNISAILNGEELATGVKGINIKITSTNYCDIDVSVRGFDDSAETGYFYTLKLITALAVRTKDSVHYAQAGLKNSPNTTIDVGGTAFNIVTANNVYNPVNS